MNLSSLSKLFNYIFWQEEPPIARKMTSPYLAWRSSGVPGLGAKRLRRAFYTGRGELAPQLRGFPVSPEGGQAPGMGEVSGNGTECGATCSPGLRRPSLPLGLGPRLLWILWHLSAEVQPCRPTKPIGYSVTAVRAWCGWRDLTLHLSPKSECQPPKCLTKGKGRWGEYGVGKRLLNFVQTHLFLEFY